MPAAEVTFFVKSRANHTGDALAIGLDQSAFASGSLRVTSYARPGKLFTASRDLVVSQVAVLKPDLFNRVVDAVVDLLRSASVPRR